MIPIDLWEHQDYLFSAMTASMKRKVRRLMLQCPTGGGKTAIATKAIQNAIIKNKIVFFVCHRKELIDQTSLTLSKFGVPHGYIASDYQPNYFHNVHICSIGTLANRIGSVPDPDLIIWDEAHHSAARGWSAVHEAYRQKFHVGLSATPERLDGRALTPYFDELLMGPQPRELMEKGRLNNYRLHTVEPHHHDTKKKIVGDVVSTWMQNAQSKLTLGFASNISDSHYYVQGFKDAGIPAVHLDAETDKDERRRVLRDLAKGVVKIVFNVGLFAEGFDISANSGMDVTIGAVLDCAPTDSLTQWLQRGGRALRPQDDVAWIGDHAGNFHRHGAFCRNRVWSLEGRAENNRLNKSLDDEEKIREFTCGKCWGTNILPVQGNVCVHCGDPIPEAKVREYEKVMGNLVQIDLAKERAAARTQEQLDLLAKKQGYKPGFSENVLKARKEKAELRRTLFNLCVAADQLKVEIPFEKSEMDKMKPQELKEYICELKLRVSDSTMVI